MNIAVLGTGMVGNTIASKLVQLGHAIMMGFQERAAENVRLGDNERLSSIYSAVKTTAWSHAHHKDTWRMMYGCMAMSMRRWPKTPAHLL